MLSSGNIQMCMAWADDQPTNLAVACSPFFTVVVASRSECDLERLGTRALYIPSSINRNTGPQQSGMSKLSEGWQVDSLQILHHSRLPGGPL